MAGSSSSTTKLPEWYTNYAKPSLELANRVAQTGYRPNVGPEIAAFNPTQVGAMQQGSDWNAAFNTPGQQAPDIQSQLMPTNSSINGQGAYSSFPQYQDMMAKFAELFPGQSDYLKGFSINPQTGAPASEYGIFNGWQTAGQKPAGTAPEMTEAQKRAQARIDYQVNRR